MLRRSVSPLLISPVASYNNFVNMGILSRDPRQEATMRIVEQVYDGLVAFKNSPAAKQERSLELRPPNRLGVVPSYYLVKQQEEKVRRAMGESPHHPLSSVKGLYLYGGVGCGKTMMMDILFNEAPLEKKMRVHFHQFMLDVHRTMHHIRSQNRTKDAEVDMFDEVAQRMVTNAELLCFDEMVVSDVSDAMILKRLFHSFYKIGVCAMFTSNRPPDDLYKGGLNRESFLPFVRMLKDRCIVHDVGSSTDYRLTGHDAKTYLCPFTPENEAAFNKLFLDVSKAMPPTERVLRVFGRDVVVRRAVGGVARFDFHELCSSEMSTADFEVIAKSFHTIFIEGVPQLPHRDSDAKRRFLLLIDTLYEFKVKVVVYAEVEPMLLEAPPERAHLSSPSSSAAGLLTTKEEVELGKKLIDEGEGSFQMQRCMSRLVEMRSTAYLQSEHKGEEVGLDTV